MMATAKVNGAEIYYEETGSGPPIILSPGGLQGVASSYQPVIEGLSQEHRVVVYDRRFGGQSRSPMVVQTWDMVCDDVFGLMDVLGIEQAYLGGGSFGAAISLGCAAYADRSGYGRFSHPTSPAGSSATPTWRPSCSRAWTGPRTAASRPSWTPSTPTTAFRPSARSWPRPTLTIRKTWSP